MANPYHGSGPLRSRVGNSDEIQLQIDPINGELDDHITGLHQKIRKLKGVAQEIETETKFQNDFISQLMVGRCDRRLMSNCDNCDRRLFMYDIREGASGKRYVCGL